MQSVTNSSPHSYQQNCQVAHACLLAGHLPTCFSCVWGKGSELITSTPPQHNGVVMGAATSPATSMDQRHRCVHMCVCVANDSMTVCDHLPVLGHQDAAPSLHLPLPRGGLKAKVSTFCILPSILWTDVACQAFLSGRLYF